MQKLHGLLAREGVDCRTRGITSEQSTSPAIDPSACLLKGLDIFVAFKGAQVGDTRTLPTRTACRGGSRGIDREGGSLHIEQFGEFLPFFHDTPHRLH